MTKKELLESKLCEMIKSVLKEEGEAKPSYYKNQLDRISTDGEYPASIIIRSGDGSSKTNNMNLNAESAAVLITWLKKNYLTRTRSSQKLSNGGSRL